MAATTQIVTVNAQVTPAPEPSLLQQSGAFVSVGGTTLTTGTYQYLASISDLAAILSATGNYAELVKMNATYFAQGNAVGVYVLELGTQSSEGQAISALNTWIESTPSQFYAYLVPADWDTARQVQSVTITAGGNYTGTPTVTFSAPGAGGTTATGTAVLTGTAVTSVTITNPGDYTTSDTVTVTFSSGTSTATGTVNVTSALNAMAAGYSSATGRTYFFTTTTSATISAYSATTKAIFALVPSPTAASTEFQTAAPFYNLLSNNPSAGTPAAPMAYRYEYGVTPWASNGNVTTIDAILTAYGNIIGTGAEGGISTAILFKGTTMDGTQMMAWYAIDWVQIQAKQRLAAAIINGSNSNPPLYYNQAGINQLLAILGGTNGVGGIGADGVSFGLLSSQSPSASLPNGTPSFTAVPFATYTAANPSAYAAGSYGGFAATVTAQNGFLTITFNLDAVEF